MLCEVCKSILGKFESSFDEDHVTDYTHHITMASYLDSVAQSCYICARLPVSYLLQFPTGYGADECFTSCSFIKDKNSFHITVGDFYKRMGNLTNEKCFQVESLSGKLIV